MPRQFTSITTVRELETVIGTSTEQPVIIFQHDPSCGTSRLAYQRLSKISYPIVIVDVSQAHGVKRAIAEQTTIRHESPQVIVFKNGTAYWSASHGAITQQAVAEALTEQSVRDDDLGVREG
ncbi:MAG: bacillithiol system redox-active protein YtxJ [Chloroflexota bacterium]|nr:bacillithiol system redox-active protein YtxJ [Chloroflexota bacterium]